MGCWAVGSKITETIRKTSNTNFLTKKASPTPSSSLYQIYSTTTSQNRLNSQYLPSNAHHKHTYTLSPIKSSPVFMNTSSHYSTVFHLFDEMPDRKQQFENTHFFCILDLIKLSTTDPNIEAVETLHSLALKVGVCAHLPTSTSLLAMYSKAGDFGSSVALFNEILYRDVIIWNAMMTACIKYQYYCSAVDFFVEMMNMGSGFDSASLVIVVSALSKMNKLKQGKVIHGLSMRTGMVSDSFLCNALTDMYAKCGDLSSSEGMFGGMQCRDLISWNSIITGCLWHDQPEKSLWYFREMGSCGEKADNVSVSCAIAASTCLGEFGIGQNIHGLAIKLGYEERSNISTANSLVSLYSQRGEIDSAHTVFKGMVFKDVISWNSMIDGFASNGKISESFCLLREMQFAGSVQPDSVTVITIMPLCAESMLLIEGKSIHGYIIRRDLGSDLPAINSLMDMYLKCNHVKAADHLFKGIPERDLVSWNTMISGYSLNGQSREAKVLFNELLHWGPHCSLSTVLAILPSCDSLESLNFGKTIHSWQLKLGYSNNILTTNSLLFMYINCGDLVASLSLLSRISSIADTTCYNTVIAGCARNGHFDEALQTFDLLRRETHVRHDSVTLVNTVSACGNLGLVLQGKLLHGLALKTLFGMETRVQNALITMYGRFGDIKSSEMVFSSIGNRNLCSWNCMISAFSQNKDGKRALELFRFLDVEPNEITISTVLSACTQLGVLRYGKEIHGHVFRFEFLRNSFISAALVDMYSNCGRLDIACLIFHFLTEKSVSAWNSMISAYGLHSNGRKSIGLFHEMIESGTKPSKSTFINLLSACSHSGLVNEGLWYYNHMFDDFGVEPVTEHHVCMVDMLGRCGRLSDAYDFIKKMPNGPEPGVWGALLSACNYHGDVEMGREVAKVLFGLQPKNVGYYVSLSNMYVAAGRWSDAVELRRIVEDKQLKKPAGYSLIDVGFG